MKAYSHPLFLAIIGLSGTVIAIGACSAPRQSAVSEEGRKACLEEVGISMVLASQSEKQQRFRQCLINIDARLTAQRKQAESEQAESETRREQQRQAQLRTWATPAERLNHCKLVQDDVIRLDQARIRAQARLIASSRDSNVSQSEVEQSQNTYNDILLEIDRLIPPSMRADWQPLDAVSRFKRCDPAEFGLSAQ